MQTQTPRYRGALLSKPLWRQVKIDPILLTLLAALTGVGLLLLHNASGGQREIILRQATYVGLGAILMIAVAHVPMRMIRDWGPALLTLTLLLLLAVIWIGVDSRGAQRWLELPGKFRFQPSELAKITLPLALASYLAGDPLPPAFGKVLVCLLGITATMLLVGMQPDLGTAILIGASGFFVLFLAGWSWKQIGALLTLLAFGAPLIWNYALRSYQKERVLTLFNAEKDPLSSGWNIIQSKTAIGSGGVWGKGWQQGSQSRLDFLPESHTDFIIAVLAEELGLVGVLCLLALYFAIVMRGLYICVRCEDSFQALLAGSISLTFFVYIVVNIGMVSGLLPVVGVPLPLVSMGGSSLVTLLLGFGLLMGIHSQQTARQK